METKYKITIPKPCHEDWDKMTPDETGRFCNSCSKSVVDFTQMLPDEIQAYFQKHSNVCGRFKNFQLDSLIIQIPNHVLYSQTKYHKMFLLALFIAMGTTLFSCADKNGNKQKIDKVEIVEDSIKTSHATMGMKMVPLPKSNDSVDSILPLNKIKRKREKEKPITYEITGDIVPEPYQTDENTRLDSIKTE